MAHFIHDHPTQAQPWLLQSNYLVVVAVVNEDALLDLIKAGKEHGLAVTAVREPDLNDQATAAAFQPGAAARRLCANLPLALRSYVSKPPPKLQEAAGM